MLCHQVADRPGVHRDAVGEAIGECRGEAAIESIVAVETPLTDERHRSATETSDQGREEIALEEVAMDDGDVARPHFPGHPSCRRERTRRHKGRVDAEAPDGDAFLLEDRCEVAGLGTRGPQLQLPGAAVEAAHDLEEVRLGATDLQVVHDVGYTGHAATFGR